MKYAPVVPNVATVPVTGVAPSKSVILVVFNVAAAIALLKVINIFALVDTLVALLPGETSETVGKAVSA